MDLGLARAGLKGAEWFFSLETLDNCWSGPSCPCLSPMPYLFDSASSCLYSFFRHSPTAPSVPCTKAAVLGIYPYQYIYIISPSISTWFISISIDNSRGERKVSMIPMQHAECNIRNPKVLWPHRRGPLTQMEGMCRLSGMPSCLR